MLPIDPGDGRAVTPAQPLTDIVPQHAMATTIIRPGAVAAARLTAWAELASSQRAGDARGGAAGGTAATGRADPIVVDAWIACNTRRLYTRD